MIKKFGISIGIGLLAWLVAHGALLPVSNPGDGSGHGPDVGTVEWHHWVIAVTKNHERMARNLGIGSAVVTFLGFVGNEIIGKKRKKQLNAQPPPAT